MKAKLFADLCNTFKTSGKACSYFEDSGHTLAKFSPIESNGTKVSHIGLSGTYSVIPVHVCSKVSPIIPR